VNGCSDTSSVIIVEESDSMNIEGVVQDVQCPSDSNGAITVTVTGGIPPYTYLWSTGDTTKDLSMLPGGTYVITVTDSARGKEYFTNLTYYSQYVNNVFY
jgi:hypothetical protein